MKTPPEERSDDEHIQDIAERLASEFQGKFSAPTVVRLVTQTYALLAEARIPVYLPIQAEQFSRDRLQAVAQMEGKIMKEIPQVLFVCGQNAGRSQMAAAMLDRVAGGRVLVRSAGSTPASQIHDNVRVAMAEIGIDLSREFPKPLTDEAVAVSDVVITMGCDDACPVYPGKHYEDWELEDPAGKPLPAVREIRQEIGRRIQELLTRLGLTVPSGS